MLLWALGTWAAFRGLLFAVDLLGLSLTPKAGRCRPQWEVFGKDHYFLNGFFRWDSGWYRHIALRGYHSKTSPSAAAFYPLYPYLCRYVGVVVGGPFVGALVVSNAATVALIHNLRRLGEHLFTPAVAKLAVVLLLAFPSSFFLSAFYTESLFLAFATGAMSCYFERRFVAAGVLGFCATLTRSTGVVLFGAVALDLIWELYRRRERFRPVMLALLLMPLGLGAFMLILWSQGRDPLAFSQVQGHWGRELQLPHHAISDTLGKIRWNLPRNAKNAQALFDLASALSFFAIAAVMALKRYRIALWSLTMFGVLLPLCTGLITSMNRYVLSLFPAFLFMAKVCQGRPQLERLTLFGFSLLLAIFSIRFMLCGWAG